MTELLITTQEQFNETVAAAVKADRAVLALFTAPTWCIPCRRFEPHWLKAVNDPDLDWIDFVKIDMGQSPEDTGRHWGTDLYNILGVPNVRFLKKGMEAVDIQSRAIVPLKRELLEFGRA